MRSEGFPFISGGSGGWTVFADSGSCGRLCSLPSVCVRGIAFLPRRWAALKECYKIICWSWISSQILAGFMAFCDMPWECRFLVAGAALRACGFCNFVAGAAFCDVAQWLF